MGDFIVDVLVVDTHLHLKSVVLGSVHRPPVHRHWMDFHVDVQAILQHSASSQRGSDVKYLT